MKHISIGKLHIVYTEKSDGNMRDNENRKKVLQTFGFESVYLPKQKHTDNILPVEEHNKKDADGLYTNKKNTPIGVLTADCMPVILTDSKTLVVIHAGWKGLFKGILEKGVDLFKNKNNVFCFIGPSAKDCCYYVQEDFLENTKKYGIKLNKRYLKRDEEGFRFSLQEVAKDKLKNKGVNHIVDFSKCTICSEDFFSYRNGDFNERILTFAWLTEV